MILVTETSSAQMIDDDLLVYNKREMLQIVVKNWKQNCK